MFVSKKFGSCLPPTDRILIEVKTIYGGFFNHLDYFSLSMLLDLQGTRYVAGWFFGKKFLVFVFKTD